MRSVLPFALLASFAAAAAAQEPASLEPDARVRVTYLSPALRTQVGSFQSWSDTAFRFRSGSASVSVPLGNLQRLEVSQGRKLSIPGGIVGLILGAGIGGLAGCLANSDSYGVFCGGQDDTKVYVGAALGGVAFGALGAVLFRRDRWTPVDLARIRAGTE